MKRFFEVLKKFLGDQRGEVEADSAPAATDPAAAKGGDDIPEGAQDFFAEQLIDDDGNPINFGEDQKEGQKQGEPQKPEKGKKPEKDDKGTDQKPEPLGVEKMFFDEKNAFNADKALEFFMPKTPGKFEFAYKAPTLAAPKSPSQNPDDNLKPWEKEAKEERTYRETLKTNLTSPLQHYLKARNELGMDEATAFNYAQQETLKGYDNHIAERDWEMRTKREQELFEKNETIGRSATVRQNARSNELSAFQEVGGEDNFRMLMFGYKSADGKIVPGIGAPILYKYFEDMNPGIKKTDSETYSKKMGEWWDNYIGDPEDGFNNLQFLFSIVKSKLWEKHKTEIIKAVRGVKEREIETRAEGRVPKPRKSAPKGEGSDPGLERYFKGPVENTV